MSAEQCPGYIRITAPLVKLEPMRADAKKNYARLLAVARDLVMANGADASLREIARTAGVGLGTLYRHFPTREALLDALLREQFDALRAQAEELALSDKPREALVTWLHRVVAAAHDYRGAIAVMVAAIDDEASPLHASCVAMKAAGTNLLTRAQDHGEARHDVSGADLFALVSALAWLREQPAFVTRIEHLSGLIAGAILTS
ncbi:transcriptional regulator, TetR family [Novosphingobium sp. B1]|nr:transcriptional regulator, TetR family [Novosphingobium sp. B1]